MTLGFMFLKSPHKGEIGFRSAAKDKDISYLGVASARHVVYRALCSQKRLRLHSRFC